MDSFKDVLEAAQSYCKAQMAEPTYNLYIDGLEPISFEDSSHITLSVRNDFICKIVTDRYLGLLKEAFKTVLGFDVDITLVVPSTPPHEVVLAQQYEANPASPQGNYEFTFENFIKGPSNQFAFAAAQAVAANPSGAYNPLFIYGPSGLGKTHLLYAITNQLKRKNEHVRVIYIKGENFTNHMIESLTRQAMKEFRDIYRSCDVLLIDDIQFIAGKTSTQEEFFHTFNALYEDGKQIILTSDRPPREIKTLEDRLKTRFEWGLIADIQPPDLELRTAIIKKKADQVNLTLPDDVLSFLAENLRSNIRQIEGAIKKLGAMSFLSGQQINMNVARSCISDLLDGAEPVNVTVDKVFSAVYHRYNIKREDLVSARRTKEIASARHVTVYLIRTITEMSLPNIGKLFNRDHSTILSSLDAVEKRKAQDDLFRIELEEMEKEVRGG